MRSLPWVPYVRVDYVDAVPPRVRNGVEHPRAGFANGFRITIAKDWAGNTGILAHELAHVQLNWFNVCLLGLPKILMSERAWKRWTEGRAYAIQTLYPNGDGEFLSRASAALLLCSSHYDLGLTYKQALTLIVDHLKGKEE